MIYGYARVSTSLQETDMQLDALRRRGVERIFHEKTSSVGARVELRSLLSLLRPGDLLVVYKLDRLARSLKDLLSILEQVDAAGCGFQSLTEPIDTVSPAGRLMLNVLGSVAEFERTLIRERSIAGQVAAFKRGVPLGVRKRSCSDEVVGEMRYLHSTGAFTYPDIASFYAVHPSTAKRVITGRKSRTVMPVLSKYL